MTTAKKSSKVLQRKTFSPGEFVFQQGDFNDRAYFVEKGKLEVFITDQKKRKIVLATITSGQIVGEMAVIEKNKSRAASVQALEESTLITISDELDRMLATADPPVKALIETLIDRVRRTNRTVIDQHILLADLEEETHMKVSRIAEVIPAEQQEQFKKEITPILDNLKETLKKYQNT